MYGFVFKLVTIFWPLCLCRYGIFLAEKRAAVQQESGCNSMSRISKMLGSMWTTLTREEKKVKCATDYYSLSLPPLSSHLLLIMQGRLGSLNFLELALLLCCCVGDHLITYSVRFFTALLQQGGGRQGTLPARAQNLPQYNDPRYVVTMATSSHITMVFCEQLLNQQPSLLCHSGQL